MGETAEILLLNTLFSELPHSANLLLFTESFGAAILLLEGPGFVKSGISGKMEVICVDIESLRAAVRKGIFNKNENNER